MLMIAAAAMTRAARPVRTAVRRLGSRMRVMNGR